jgi:hypothetical protein
MMFGPLHSIPRGIHAHLPLDDRGTSLDKAFRTVNPGEGQYPLSKLP